MTPTAGDRALAAKYPDMGMPVEAYRPMIAVPIVGVVTALLAGGLLYYQVMQHMGTAPSRGGNTAMAGNVLAIFAFILLIGGFVMFVMSVGYRVLICENGVIVADKQKVKAVPWADVEGVYYAMSGGVPILSAVMARHLRIETTAGDRVDVLVTFNRNAFVVATAITDRIGPARLKAAKDRLAKGKAVAFGKKILVRPAGVEWDGLDATWGRIKRVEWGMMPPSPTRTVCYDTAVFLIGFGPPRPLFTGDVPNVPVLLDLLESECGVKVSRQTGNFF